jgi:uncharacterized protein YjbI with pentapeptide repeats
MEFMFNELKEVWIDVDGCTLFQEFNEDKNVISCNFPDNIILFTRQILMETKTIDYSFIKSRNDVLDVELFLDYIGLINKLKVTVYLDSIIFDEMKCFLYPNTIPIGEFYRTCLNDEQINNINFTNAFFKYANFKNVTFTNCSGIFYGEQCVFTNCIFINCNFTFKFKSSLEFKKVVTFTNSVIKNAVFDKSNCYFICNDTKMIRASFKNVTIKSFKSKNCNFSQSDFYCSNIDFFLTNVNLSHSNFVASTLCIVEAINVKVDDSNFSFSEIDQSNLLSLENVTRLNRVNLI